ncbi:hypothetical protein SARC_13913 [Sphaeroforma arctica JP610]|uniref:Uncharacterized protein n=1 Tax=Sphaeroforma arctica JP610 TaxID=667725 RepID=A0A0L0FBR8_9EUKA|nr:hypothetical protein SARC_13913 [Sphaeroforma arctica JP610]KNC73528.1 hypothetical protein SARC_13913 [Sphaeroforma arctica JP610]|eukprot:XP_014147430.1 hypothetical protein SARC_13913 [Sphaeroforma arctica JP610]
MPWKTLITITKYSGKRLSSVLLHIVFRLSFGGDTLLSLWIEWVLGVQDLEEELNHIREYSGIDPRILRKCGDIVEKHYPFNAEKFSSRQNLSDLLISSLGEPSLDCEFVDGLSEQSLGSIYAYLNLLVDFKDGTDVRKKLLDDKRVIRFATEMLGFAEALFIDLIVHGNMCVFLTELHDLLKPLLKGDHVNCKGERLEGFSYMCETAADKLLRSVFKFIHSAVINGKQVQRVLVWVLDSFSRGPVVPESCETLSERRSSSASGGSGRPKHRKSSFKKKSTGISTDNQRPAHGPNDGEVLNLEAMVEQTFPGTAQRAELEREVAEVIDFYKYSRKGGEPPKLESLEKLVTPLRQWYMSRMLTL